MGLNSRKKPREGRSSRSDLGWAEAMFGGQPLIRQGGAWGAEPGRCAGAFVGDPSRMYASGVRGGGLEGGGSRLGRFHDFFRTPANLKVDKTGKS